MVMLLYQLNDLEEHQERNDQTINSNSLRERDAEDHVGQQVPISIRITCHASERALYAQADANAGARRADHRQTRANEASCIQNISFHTKQASLGISYFISRG